MWTFSVLALACGVDAHLRSLEVGPDGQMALLDEHAKVFNATPEEGDEFGRVPLRLKSQCGMGAEGAAAWKQYADLHASERAKGCAGRYLVAKPFNGLGDCMHIYGVWMQLAMATDRALLLQDPTLTDAFQGAAVNWVPPEGCSWSEVNELSLDMGNDPDEGKKHLDAFGWEGDPKQPFKAAVQRLASSDPVVIGAHVRIDGTYANWRLMGTANRRTVLADYLHKELPQMGLVDSVRSGVRQPLGCVFDYLFKPTPPLMSAVHGLSRSLGIAPTDTVRAVHWRVGDTGFKSSLMHLDRQGNKPGNFTQHWEEKFFAQTLAAIKPCAQDGSLACAGGSAPILFFSDNMQAKLAAKEAGYLTSNVVPAHRALQSKPDGQKLLDTWAELLIMSRARTVISVGYHSHFAMVAAEVGLLNRPVREFMVYLDVQKKAAELCGVEVGGPYHKVDDSTCKELLNA